MKDQGVSYVIQFYVQLKIISLIKIWILEALFLYLVTTTLVF